MKKEEKINFLKQSYNVLEGLAKDINQKMDDAKSGLEEENANLIIGSLSGIEETAQHLKNIYEAMLFIHRN
ncbi:hypothetical protein AAIR98_001365 [Elusimicrobium simillimum]|uniref:hypothetical protein n=1 Tax=Elusimicrobium simillimum TaxID=3143438 RepID=UPI003C6F3783